MLRRVIIWAVVIAAACYLASDPSAAGHAAGHIADGITGFGRSLATFVGSL